MKLYPLFFAIVLSSISVNSFGFDHEHKIWNSVLSKYVSSSGGVNYKLLKKDITKNKTHEFTNYIKDLQAVKQKDFDQFSKDQQLAFLINAYNALTVQLIIDNYPVKSIKKIGSIFKNAWKQNFFSLLSGQIKNLDSIEHKWIRPKYKDYRIHAAVNCASISCPQLRNEAYTSKKLNEQLEEQMKIWINDKSKNKLNLKTGVFQISKIFDWYEVDFTKWGKGVLNVVKKYSEQKEFKESDVKIKYLEYNWNLNEERK